MSETSTYFIEYFVDDPIPISHFVDATEDELPLIEAWLEEHYPDDGTYFGLVVPITFDTFKKNWMDEEE